MFNNPAVLTSSIIYAFKPISFTIESRGTYQFTTHSNCICDTCLHLCSEDTLLMSTW